MKTSDEALKLKEKKRRAVALETQWLATLTRMMAGKELYDITKAAKILALGDADARLMDEYCFREHIIAGDSIFLEFNEAIKVVDRLRKLSHILSGPKAKAFSRIANYVQHSFGPDGAKIMDSVVDEWQ